MSDKSWEPGMFGKTEKLTLFHFHYLSLLFKYWTEFSCEDEQRAWTRGSEWGGPEDDRQSDFKIEFYENSRKFKITITVQQEKTEE